MGYSLSNIHMILISLTGSITDFKWSSCRMNPYPNSNDTDNKSKQCFACQKEPKSFGSSVQVHLLSYILPRGFRTYQQCNAKSPKKSKCRDHIIGRERRPNESVHNLVCFYMKSFSYNYFCIKQALISDLIN